MRGILSQHLLHRRRRSRLRNTGVKYDPVDFHYLGGADTTRSAFIVWKTAGVRSMTDVTRKRVILGATGKGSQTYTVPTIVNALLGTRFKTILGYRGMGGIYLAMERGEVQGFQSVWASIHSLRPQWIKDKRLTLLAANSLDPLPDRPDVPLLKDLITDPEGKKIAVLVAGNGVLGRCWLAPPRVPAERVAALRAAFEAALNDPAAKAGTAERRMNWAPVGWQALQNQVKHIVDADAALFDRMRVVFKKK